MTEGSLPAWFTEGQDRPAQNRRSRAQERSRAKEVGGKVQSGSGSSWRARGDVRTEEVLEQLKYTDAASYRLSVDEWKQIEADAMSQGREAVLIVEFAKHGLRLKIERLD